MTGPRSRTVSQLCFAEQIVLWGLRTWLGGVNGRARVAAELEGALGEIDGGRAAAALGGMIEIIGTSARRTVTVGPAPCPRLWSDEELLLNALGSLHQGFETESARLLGQILPPGAVRLVMAHAETLSEILFRLGYPMSVRQDQANAERSGADPSPTIH